MAIPPPVGFPVVIAAVTYNGSAEEATEFYAPLLSLQILMNTTASMPYSQINTSTYNTISISSPIMFHVPTSHPKLFSSLQTQTNRNTNHFTQKSPTTPSASASAAP